jgi:hypothetical protein
MFHTNSYIDRYLPWYIKNLVVYMDNTGNGEIRLLGNSVNSHENFIAVATNKNKYVLNAVGAEFTRIGRLQTCELAFLIVGHTKSCVDRMFANWSSSWKRQDCYNHLYVVGNHKKQHTNF